uniref:Uncharacterized protein n=1 Tax=Steinernema glaseri TaxID=37863 RepID=A0A1I7Z2Y7_9BILA
MRSINQARDKDKEFPCLLQSCPIAPACSLSIQFERNRSSPKFVMQIPFVVCKVVRTRVQLSTRIRLSAVTFHVVTLLNPLLWQRRPAPASGVPDPQSDDGHSPPPPLAAAISAVALSVVVYYRVSGGDEWIKDGPPLNRRLGKERPYYISFLLAFLFNILTDGEGFATPTHCCPSIVQISFFLEGVFI